jgi:uncharacterized iron-regulated membrane protein
LPGGLRATIVVAALLLPLAGLSMLVIAMLDRTLAKSQ